MTNLVSNWVSSDGGPLLLVAEEYLLAWEGCENPSAGRKVEAQFRWNLDGVATDYDRACDVHDWVGLIEVGQGKGLVLGDEPLTTTWFPLADGGLLVRWVCADSEEELIAAARKIPDSAYVDSGLCLQVRNSPLVLLQASESWDDQFYSRLEIQLMAGDYSISTSEYDADGMTSLICHRLKRKSA
jgi:hypothetical protein